MENENPQAVQPTPDEGEDNGVIPGAEIPNDQLHAPDTVVPSGTPGSMERLNGANAEENLAPAATEILPPYNGRSTTPKGPTPNSTPPASASMS